MASSWFSDVQTTVPYLCISLIYHTLVHSDTCLPLCDNCMVTRHTGWLYGQFLCPAGMHQDTKTLIWWLQTLTQQHILEAELRVHWCQGIPFVSLCGIYHNIAKWNTCFNGTHRSENHTGSWFKYKECHLTSIWNHTVQEDGLEMGFHILLILYLYNQLSTQ